MIRPRTSVTLSIGAVLLAVTSCTSDTPTSPLPRDPEAAQASGGGPSVKSTVPDSGFRSTTIDVRVLGAGFDRGSRAVWGLNGDTAFTATRIKTNSTRYVKSSELLANITIGADAPLDRFDVVVVTSNGKKGIGIELFAVEPQITDLGALPNGWPSFPLRVSAGGTAVGYGYTGPNYSGAMHALRWNLDGGTVTLEDLTARLGNSIQSQAWSLNEAGDIAGTYKTSAGQYHAYLLTAAGMTDLHPLCGGAADGKDVSNAYGVNVELEVVGTRGLSSGGTSGSYRAFYWKSGCMVELPSLGGNSQANAINDNGVIVGGSGGYAVRWTKNPNVPGGWDIVPLGTGSATAINRAGDAVGYGGKLWPASGGEILLGTFGGEIPGVTTTMANGIDDDGTVVGWSLKVSGVGRAFRWTATTGMVELVSFSSAKGSGSGAYAISAGRIVGFGDVGTSPLITKSETHAVLWTGY
jgi:probable HAF family extracellular repeat protein